MLAKFSKAAFMQKSKLIAATTQQVRFGGGAPALRPKTEGGRIMATDQV